MLVLTRIAGESLLIGDTVTVTVLSIHGGQVRIGIEAPRDVVVLREEVATRDLGDDSHQPRKNAHPDR